MSIGPQIPHHLLAQFQRPDDDATAASIGPELPTLVRKAEPKIEVDDAIIGGLNPEDDAVDHGNVGPSTASFSGNFSGNRIIGPSFPSTNDSDDDDDVGPKPLAAGRSEQPDPVKEFIEREESRKKAVQEALKPKAPKREEWMLVPPTTAGLLGNLDPLKHRGRQFSHGKTTSSDKDMSLWTETPAERQQRLADEVQGKKRRVTDAALVDEEELERKRRRKKEEERMRKGVDDYTRKRRGPALVDRHKEALSQKPPDKEEAVVWDHARDMAIGGRLMDDDKRGKMLKEAKGLGDRFNSGEIGGFL